MSQLRLKQQKFLKGNAGFSLVELIIVIAIMAALIAILAPQYMKYVDKSRKAADAATAEEIFTACKVVATDETIDADFEVTWNGATLEVTGDADAEALVFESLGMNDDALVAKFKGDYDPVYTVEYTLAVPDDPDTTGTDESAVATVAITSLGWFN